MLPIATARAAAVLAAGILSLGACSDDPEAAPAPAVHTADNGEVFNDADAEFADALVRAHAATLALVDLARSKEAAGEIARLGEEILVARGPEIEAATDWLVAWDLPIPETVRDHSNVGHGEVVTADDEDLNALAALDGEAFTQRWLELMVARHESTVALAEDEIDDGRYSPALAMAEALAEDQQARLEEMRALLAG